MKPLLMIGLCSILTFGLSFGASMYLQQQRAVQIVDDGPPAEIVPDEPMETEFTALTTHAEGALSNEALPSAIRPRAASVEELVRLGMSLNDREKQVVAKEEAVQKRELQQQLALVDLSSERQSLDGFRAEVRTNLETAQQLLNEMTAVYRRLTEEREATPTGPPSTNAAATPTDVDRRGNTKKLAQWMQGMDATKSAQLLQEMANDGQLDAAVEVLAYFEEREAAKLLSAIDDPKLVNELVTRFVDLKSTRQAQPE